MFKKLFTGPPATPKGAAPLRTITTARGTRFDVMAETDHFIACLPPTNGETPTSAILDIEDMAQKGLYICDNGVMVLFEKRPPRQPV